MSGGASEVREVGAGFEAGSRAAGRGAEGDPAGRDGRREDGNVPVGYKRTEVGVIPEDWEVRSIGEIAPLQRGFDLPISQIEEGLYPIVYSNGIWGYHSRAMVNGPGVVTGRSGTLGRIRYVEGNFWPHNTTLWVTSFKANYPKYVYYLFIGLRFERFASGSGVPTLNRNDAHLHRIAIAPAKKEQQAIAEALSDADRLIESIDKLIAKKRAVKQAAMQQLLTAKTRLPGFSGEWETKRLGEIADCYSGGTPSTTFKEYYGGAIPWITSSDLNVTYIRRVEGRITQKGLVNSAARMIESGTVLVALYGAIAGISAISMIRAAINQAVLAVYPLEDDHAFLFYKLTSLRDKLRSRYTQGGQPNLSGAIVKSIDFDAPGLEEQTAIAAVLSDMDAKITVLEKRRDKAKAVKHGMMQELLTGRIRLDESETRAAE